MDESRKENRPNEPKKVMTNINNMNYNRSTEALDYFFNQLSNQDKKIEQLKAILCDVSKKLDSLVSLKNDVLDIKKVINNFNQIDKSNTSFVPFPKIHNQNSVEKINSKFLENFPILKESSLEEWLLKSGTLLESYNVNYLSIRDPETELEINSNDTFFDFLYSSISPCFLMNLNLNKRTVSQLLRSVCDYQLNNVFNHRFKYLAEVSSMFFDGVSIHQHNQRFMNYVLELKKNPILNRNINFVQLYIASLEKFPDLIKQISDFIETSKKDPKIKLNIELILQYTEKIVLAIKTKNSMDFQNLSNIQNVNKTPIGIDKKSDIRRKISK